ncbi:MAG: hypothetical protein Q4G43_15725 [Mobilicoccus sp.]|nr:hypothetical protein [Mobilicoccus sp.]
MKLPTSSSTPVRTDATGSVDVWGRFTRAGACAVGLAVVVAGAIALPFGMTAAGSAIAGAALAGIFLMVGFVGLRLALAAPTLWQLPAAVALYSTQVAVLLVLWLSFERGRLDVPAFDAIAFGLGALAATLTWQAVLVKTLLSARLTVNVTPSAEPAGERA